jgi:hypothetical protein
MVVLVGNGMNVGGPGAGEPAIQVKQHRATSIYTSMPPQVSRCVGGKPFVKYQEAFINSWKDAGFRIVSVNSDKEIDLLKNYSSDVEFVSNGTYDDRSKLSVFFEHIISSREPYAGIVNADCILFNYDDLVSGLLAEALGSVLLLERLNIDPDTARPTGRSCSGFDAFFFDTKFLDHLKKGNHYEIGQPMWDFWFPIAMSLAGAELKIPVMPVILHVDHVQNWRWDTFRANGDRLLEFLLDQKDLKSMPGFRAEVAKIASAPRFGARYLHKLCALTFKSLQANGQPVSPALDGSHADLLSRMFVGLSQSKELYFRERANQLTVLGRLRTFGSLPKVVARKAARRLFP